VARRRGPTVGVSGLARRKGRVLLVQRGTPPNRGKWSLPGGGVEWGETLRDALVREFREETGLRVRPEPLVDVLDVRLPSRAHLRYHFVVAVFRVRILGGRLRPGAEEADVRWVPVEDLDAFDVEEVTRLLLKRAIP